METYYLGTHMPNWVKTAGVPLFLSARRLRHHRPGRAACDWALDSGGFSELSLYATWATAPEQYAWETRRWRLSIGRLRWAAAQDWMCEPFMTDKTGKTVADHQRLTVENYLKLKELAPEVPWAPVLQGYKAGQYLDHYEQYERAGARLHEAPVVGVGSVCRRQGSDEITRLFQELRPLGLKLHAFGVKTLGLQKIAHLIHSADSLAWSLDARRSPPLPGCTHSNCANCLKYALAWRRRLLESV